MNFCTIHDKDLIRIMPKWLNGNLFVVTLQISYKFIRMTLFCPMKKGKQQRYKSSMTQVNLLIRTIDHLVEES